ncbi:hypothetical protein DCO17_01300 [Polynucleobacter tropicus]|uniref:Glycosyltransferase family 1 protein n=1 Tax=Polynucleobacter tropicus TaxID=1743174 RepID=A0A6M9Q5M7_9BURK|nr:hypothetical protein [Polynucleobacter tropicus]QKM63983.1 hypothetical protein DCO17_01300 [Polynucleobacter tropicus]
MIAVILFFKNLLSRRKLNFIRVNQAFFVFNQSYDKVLSDYYFYLVGLLGERLHLLSGKCLLYFGAGKFSLFGWQFPVYKIGMQVEHTLVKSGGRDSDGALPGAIPIEGQQSNYLVRIPNVKELLEADIIFDYSRINQENIKKCPELSQYESKSFCISPALYQMQADSFSLSHPRDLHTITLFGNPNEGRRKTFLEALAGLNVESRNINNCFDGIENLYRNTKIIVNIRQTDHHDTLEELRILPALRCGALVVSERAPLVHLTRYSKFIIWGDLHELPSLILDVQTNYEQWHNKIFGDHAFFRRMQRISRRNELMSMKALNRLEKHITDRVRREKL